MKKEMKKNFFQGGISALGGVWSWGVSPPGGCLLWRCLVLGGVWSGGLLQGGLVLGGVCSGAVSTLVLGVCLLRGVSTLGGGVWSQGGCLVLGVSAPGGVCSRGVSAPGGCGIPACTEADTPTPHVNRMTDRCKNITLATTSSYVMAPLSVKDDRFDWPIRENYLIQKKL